MSQDDSANRPSGSQQVPADRPSEGQQVPLEQPRDGVFDSLLQDLDQILTDYNLQKSSIFEAYNAVNARLESESDLTTTQSRSRTEAGVRGSRGEQPSRRDETAARADGAHESSPDDLPGSPDLGGVNIFQPPSKIRRLLSKSYQATIVMRVPLKLDGRACSAFGAALQAWPSSLGGTL
ncbi:uncharacterized protein EI90DRAFT_3139542 [Cantharellus anzutake]|uniref:uncharacterized protein n=1 Tax=Cantharellus anzutake TaxID=1750568 RepID=UPI001905CF13|nr:uncharacterized protein EI90DRAFT_3139542 [Cantharellus anzutake]KAF8310523.1 hypothetical protein EI90DRAFT_3139542 [Cantharellus anzutake]